MGLLQTNDWSFYIGIWWLGGIYKTWTQVMVCPIASDDTYYCENVVNVTFFLNKMDLQKY